MFVRPDLTQDGNMKCPACGGDKFQNGPAAGDCRNIRCLCGAEWNSTPLGLEPVNGMALTACDPATEESE